MKASKRADVHADSTEAIVEEIREIIESAGSVVISGEVGVGKIIHTIEALRDADNIYYVGNPVDFAGKPRPKGYDKYIAYIKSLKRGMHIIADEKELLAFDFQSVSGTGAILLIDEIYGRSPEQYARILGILDKSDMKVVLIAGCLKNVGRIIKNFEVILMLTNDGTLLVDKEFILKMSAILRSDSPEGQAGLFQS
ncbi:MAG TPA: hypothetical protein VEI96_02310 [Thermodesulfovibrionales bacterium]|nr:hypothetical protein [Thermodesulfovibrionales bacterium]